MSDKVGKIVSWLGWEGELCSDNAGLYILVGDCRKYLPPDLKTKELLLSLQPGRYDVVWKDGTVASSNPWTYTIEGKWTSKSGYEYDKTETSFIEAQSITPVEEDNTRDLAPGKYNITWKSGAKSSFNPWLLREDGQWSPTPYHTNEGYFQRSNADFKKATYEPYYPEWLSVDGEFARVSSFSAPFQRVNTLWRSNYGSGVMYSDEKFFKMDPIRVKVQVVDIAD